VLKEDAKKYGIDKGQIKGIKGLAKKTFTRDELGWKAKPELLKIMAAKNLRLDPLLPAVNMTNQILAAQEKEETE